MGEKVEEWKTLWGAKVKWPADMPDDMMKDAVETVRAKMEEYPDFDADGLQVTTEVKKAFDAKWGPSWHCIIGRHFGSFVTHESRNFLFFYLSDKAVLLFKAG
eukprot:PLAT11015.1.p1 GENE.PLAT11015.1~~PLAT11015.1.p1  ORF type:complete len:119 (-),score=34.12 PLAT11015.1:167-475(-)